MDLRNSLVEILMHEFEGKTAANERFEALVDMVHEQLPSSILRDVVRESLRPLAGVPLDEDLIRSTCHRIAGNLERLKALRPVRPWTVQRFPEWVPVQIMACNRTLNRRGDVGATFVFKIVAGSSCPLLIRKFWSLKQCRYLATHDFGFSRVKRHAREGVADRLFAVPEQLVTLRLYVLIEGSTCYEGKPGFVKIHVPPSVRAWNSEQLKLRFRQPSQLKMCVEGQLPSQLPCHRCPRGYGHSCRGGTHASDYVFQHCDECDTDNVPFDVDRSNDVCVACYLQNAWKRDKKE